jgi:hypothetical protein
VPTTCPKAIVGGVDDLLRLVPSVEMSPLLQHVNSYLRRWAGMKSRRNVLLPIELQTRVTSRARSLPCEPSPCGGSSTTVAANSSSN